MNRGVSGGTFIQVRPGELPTIRYVFFWFRGSSCRTVDALQTHSGKTVGQWSVGWSITVYVRIRGLSSRLNRV